MHRRNDLLIPFLAVCADYIAIVAAFLAAYFVRFESVFKDIVEVSKGFPPFSAYVVSALVFAPVWIGLLQSRKLYRIRRDVDYSAELFQIIKLISLGMLLVLMLAFFYRGFSYSRIVFAMIWVLAIVFVFLSHVTVFSFEKFLYRRGKELRNVLLVGTNTLAGQIALRISQRPALGYRLTGYLAAGAERLQDVDIPCLGDLDSISRIVTEQRIETVMVCLGRLDEGLLAFIHNTLEGKSLQILLQPEILGMLPSRLRIEEVFGVPFVGIKDIPMSTWSRIMKRSFDIVMSAAVLILFAPFALLIMILIRIDSGRPVFYRQVRVGLDGTRFTLLKFRTMTQDAEQATGPTWTRKGDARVTRLGRFLRRSSLDEMPQFINVFRGDMSIVGPRPERPEFVSQFSQFVPKYLERHRVKTGLTGWAQVNGLRGDVPISDRTKYDLYYIENWSFKFDIKIIFKTVYAILFGKDAY
jgi:exopolysaccharide biosynthesis polyprenyl glycosylphosphotransferase